MNIEDKKKIFIVSGTNTGGTVLQNLLCSAKNTSGLGNEGRNLIQDWMEENDDYSVFPYDRDWDENIRLFLKRADVLEDKENYHWGAIRKIFADEWDDDEVLIEKSPGNICRLDMIDNTFENASFLFLIRHPAAQIEGIRRRAICDLGEAIDHTVEWCKRIMDAFESWRKSGEVIKYSHMCKGCIHPVLSKLGVNGVDYERAFRVHNITSDIENTLTNFNQKNIDNLYDEELRRVEDNLIDRLNRFMQIFGFKYHGINSHATI